MVGDFQTVCGVLNPCYNMKLLICILMPLLMLGQPDVRWHDLTKSLDSMKGGWGIGNACGVDFRLNGIYKGDLDMEGEPLEILNAHFVVEGNIVNQGSIVYLCDDAVLEIKGEVLGVVIPEANEVKIYPNPALHEVNIKGIEVSDLALFDMQGRKLKHYKTFGQLHRIMVDDLEAGIYLLVINKTLTHKIVKT